MTFCEFVDFRLFTDIYIYINELFRGRCSRNPSIPGVAPRGPPAPWGFCPQTPASQGAALYEPTARAAGRAGGRRARTLVLPPLSPSPLPHPLTQDMNDTVRCLLPGPFFGFIGT